MEQWQDALMNIIREGGKNHDLRLLPGKITSVSPLRFQPDITDRPIPARFARNVGDGAAENEPVLAIQEIESGDVYVIARLM